MPVTLELFRPPFAFLYSSFRIGSAIFPSRSSSPSSSLACLRREPAAVGWVFFSSEHIHRPGRLSTGEKPTILLVCVIRKRPTSVHTNAKFTSRPINPEPPFHCNACPSVDTLSGRGCPLNEEFILPKHSMRMCSRHLLFELVDLSFSSPAFPAGLRVELQIEGQLVCARTV